MCNINKDQRNHDKTWKLKEKMNEKSSSMRKGFECRAKVWSTLFTACRILLQKQAYKWFSTLLRLFLLQKMRTHIVCARKKISVMQFLASQRRMTAMLIFLIRKIASKNDAIFAPANGGWPFPSFFIVYQGRYHQILCAF